jgi:hypothetical protein
MPDIVNLFHLAGQKRYMTFFKRGGWHVQFTEGDLKTPLPETFTFADPYATGKFQQKDLANRFNVPRSSLRKIVRRESWKHL